MFFAKSCRQIIKICQKKVQKKVDQEKQSLLCQKTASIWQKQFTKAEEQGYFAPPCITLL